MSNQNMDQTPDSVDDLLSNAFDQALTGSSDQLLVDRVMARIARRERQRMLVMALFGLVALLLCMLGAAPLLELIPELFSGLLADASPPVDGQLNLPLTALVVGMLVAGGWLILEEATG